MLKVHWIPIPIMVFTETSSQLYRDGDFEEGKTDTVPYDEKKDGIVILEPGTYYAAVYTPSFFEDFEASYLSYICPLNQQGELRENETKKRSEERRVGKEC